MKVRHKKRSTTYTVLGEAEVQISVDHKGLGTDRRLLKEGDTLVVYKGEDGKLWARFPNEFHDGRFEEVK